MRTVFIGAGPVSIETARVLSKKGHEIIIIDTDKAKIDEFSEEMDCSFLHGDGSQPNLLGELLAVAFDHRLNMTSFIKVIFLDKDPTVFLYI